MLKKGQVTIKDIAKALNISTSTVSRALKNHPDISSDTKRLVNDLAKEYNYTPNTLALSLKNSKSNIIGVCVPKISHFFFSSVIEGIELIAEQYDYHVFVTQSDESEEKEKKNIHAFLKSRVAGVLVSMSKTTKEFSHFNSLEDNGIPMVFFDRICPEINSHRVVADDYQGALAAVEYLIGTGCKRIAFFHSPMHLEISKNRMNGYKDALIKNRIEIDPSLMVLCDCREEAINETSKIMSISNPPDAFFTVNDRTATGVLYTVKKMGFRVPEDISICGFSNGLVAEVTDPPLTTVEQHGLEIGMNAMKLLINSLNDADDKEIYKQLIKTNLVIRSSTRPA